MVKYIALTLGLVFLQGCGTLYGTPNSGIEQGRNNQPPPIFGQDWAESKKVKKRG